MLCLTSWKGGLILYVKGSIYHGWLLLIALNWSLAACKCDALIIPISLFTVEIKNSNP